MAAERARLHRLQRLERVRAIARHQAAREAAQAEGTLAQLEALAERTRRMAEEYRGRTAQTDGLELRQLGQFVSGLSGISTTTRGDAAQARELADRKQQELALAERRRAAVEDRARGEQRTLDQRRAPLALDGRRRLGTSLE